jgi:hypothetical protein
MPVPVVQQLKIGKAILAKRCDGETRCGKATCDVVPLAVQALGMGLIALVSSLSLGDLCLRLQRGGEGCTVP